MKRYFGTDGIRGKVGSPNMSAEFILRLGQAAGSVIARRASEAKQKSVPSVLIGKDTRISGYMFESALEAGFVAAGVNVHLSGPIPTPAVSYLSKAFRANAGIVISASHNPFGDNGVKFFGENGEKLPDDMELEIEAELDKPFATVAPDKLGKVYRVDTAKGRYIEFCKGTVSGSLSLDGMRIVLDCANGAAYDTAPHVLRELGAEVIGLADRPDGLNINFECGSTHPKALQKKVVESQADLGIALDGDADRVLMVDHTGKVLDGDQLIYMIAKQRHQAGLLSGPVVGTVMSNLGMELALDKLSIPFVRAAVGDRYVMEALHAQGGIIGGEPSGHIICLDRTGTGDGVVSALQILEIMVSSGAKLADLVSDWQQFPQLLINVPTEKASAIVTNDQIVTAVADAEAQLGREGRVVLRPSGTEPLVRVMVEGRDECDVERHAEAIAEVVRTLG